MTTVHEKSDLESVGLCAAVFCKIRCDKSWSSHDEIKMITTRLKGENTPCWTGFLQNENCHNVTELFSL